MGGKARDTNVLSGLLRPHVRFVLIRHILHSLHVGTVKVGSFYLSSYKRAVRDKYCLPVDGNALFHFDKFETYFL